MLTPHSDELKLSMDEGVCVPAFSGRAATPSGPSLFHVSGIAGIPDATKPVANHFGEGGVAKGATGFATHRGPSQRPSGLGL